MGRTFTSFEAGERTYPVLSASQRDQLNRIAPSIDGALRYFPCCVRLRVGQLVDRVYLVEAQSYISVWGVWPDQDAHKHEVKIEDVVEIFESPTRMPVNFANELYRAGESGMGYTVFTMRFRDGSEHAVATGNAIDFVPFPAGQTAADIIEVVPHHGHERAVDSTQPYYWCIYGSGKPHAAEQAVAADRHASSRARRMCVISVCTRAAHQAAARCR